MKNEKRHVHRWKKVWGYGLEECRCGEIIEDRDITNGLTDSPQDEVDQMRMGMSRWRKMIEKNGNKK